LNCAKSGSQLHEPIMKVEVVTRQYLGMSRET